VKDGFRFTMSVVLAGCLMLAGAVACGKKSAPIAPEDVPPEKQERSK
jgi:hypothetical protein